MLFISVPTLIQLCNSWLMTQNEHQVLYCVLQALPCGALRAIPLSSIITPSPTSVHLTSAMLTSFLFFYMETLLSLETFARVVSLPRNLCTQILKSVWLSSVPQSCPTLCNPMDWSMPGFPVHHELLEPAQTHVHRISDTIQSSHLSFCPLLLLSSIFPSIRVFSNESALPIR